jgi:tetratricopeptide (TPR) repeat protein
MALALDAALARCSPPVFALFVVAGCGALGPAQAPGSEATLARASAATEVPAAPPAPAGPAVEESPYYRILVAEVAGHRGQLELSVSQYLAVARQTRDPRVAERAVRVAAYARNEAAALEGARLWAELAPTSHEAHRVLAGLFLRAGRVEEAVAEIRTLFEVLKTTPAQTYALLVEMLARERDDATALEAMDRFAAGSEDDPMAQIARANLAVRRSHLDRATAILDEVLARHPDEASALLLRAQVLQNQGKSEEAIGFLGQALERRPDDAVLRVAYGRLLVAAKRYPEAVQAFRQVVARAPENGEARFALALLLLQTEQLDEAEEQLRVVASRGTRQASGRFYLGQLAEGRGRLDEAKSWYRQVDSGEHFLDAQIRVGVLLAREGRLDQAREHLQGIETTGEGDQARVFLVEAELLTEAGRYEDAMTLYNLALEETPDELDLLYSRAMLAEKMDRIDDLERDLRAILARDPDHAQALNALGYTLADRNTRLDEAHALITRALELRPDDYFILDSMGWVLYRMGRVPEALDFLRRAAALSDDAEVAVHLGEVLWVSGDQAGAREVWQAALERKPGDERILEVMRRFLP